jgi:hypothetical protein
MRKMRIPSPATAIALVALVIAMSGSAYAATGGTFILGHSNKATSTTSLSNSKGTALALSSGHGKPPLTVNSGVQVPNLNASELGGHHASAFLRTNGTAANSSALGGIPAESFLPGNELTMTIRTNDDVPFPVGPVSMVFTCNENGVAPQANFSAIVQPGTQLWWLDKDGNGYAAPSTSTAYFLTPSSYTTSTTSFPYTVTVEAAWSPNHVVFAQLSISADEVTQTCSFAELTVGGR